MERVVAWPGSEDPGFVNLHWSVPEGRGHGIRGKPFRDLNEFMSMAQYAATKPAVYKEIYFCTSTQSTTGKVVHGHATAFRNARTTVKFKAIWLDIDVKSGNPVKNYETVKEALIGLDKFRAAAKLPPVSALVFSGGGVHVYWFSDKPLTQEEWRPYAEGLKAEAIRLGLLCDAGITADPARVLRVPGTFNNKLAQPRPVKVAPLGVDYDFSTALAHLAQAAPVAARIATGTVTSSSMMVAPFDLSAFAGKNMAPLFQQAGLNAHFDNLAEGISGRSDLPLDPAQVFRGCIHYRDAGVTHGAKHAEPLWNLTLLGATWFDDGRKWAHYFSKGHPGYTKPDTNAKFDQKLHYRANGTGWPGCSQFESAGAACKTCPFYGKLKSPLNLAERVHVKGEPSINAAAPPVPPEDMFLPAGYTVRSEDGWICQLIEKNLPNGVTVNEMLPLFMCKIRNPRAQRGSRKFMFETSLDGDTWGEVSMMETDLSTEQTLVKAIRLHGCKPFPDNQKRLVQFMTSWMAKLDAAKKRLNTVPFGWLRDEKGGDLPIGFAYGGRVIMTGLPEQPAGFSDTQVEAMYSPKGTKDAWWRAVKVVTDQVRPANEAIIALGFGAPLMYATGLYNAIVCAWSNESAAHKSTAAAIGGAIWGSPVLTKVRPIASEKGIIRKVGHIQNLPVYMDEISELEQMDAVRALVNILSEGGDGDKLHQDRTLYEIQTWQTLMFVGSNQSLLENIMRNVSYTDAKLQRVMEFKVPKRDWGLLNGNDVDTLIDSLNYNYGHVGLEYSKMLGSDPGGIAKLLREHRDLFNEQVGFKTEERFRSAAAAAIYTGAVLGNRLGVQFHLPELWEFLKAEFIVQRGMIKSAVTIGGTAENTVDQLTHFIKAHVKNILTIHNLPVKKIGNPLAIAYIAGPTRDKPDDIHVRCSITERFIDVSRKELGKWLGYQKASVGSVADGLTKHYGATTIEKVDLAVGAGVHGGRETIIRIPVPSGSPFEPTLFTNVPMDMRPTDGPDEPVGSGPTPPVTGPVTSGIAAAIETAAKDLALVRQQ